MTENIKPCPFCGGEAKIHQCAEIENGRLAAMLNGKVGIHCGRCKIATIPYDTETEAIKAWNRRSDDGCD